MNGAVMPQNVTAETQLIEEALSALTTSTGITGRQYLRSGAHNISLNIAATDLDFACEIKKNIHRATLLNDIKVRSDPERTTLLVCNRLTSALADHCRALDLQFIDTAGNTYLTNNEGILINVVGRKNDTGSALTLDQTITPAALRMMFAFLAKPKMLNAPYRDISTSVQVSTGAIGKALETLERRGFIGTTAHGNRIINAPELMLSEWATGYTSRLKPKQKKYRLAAPASVQFASQWMPEFHISAWGGEIAAEKVTGHLNPSTCTIYMDMEESRALPEMVRQYQLRSDPHGPIEVVQPFWNMDYFDDSFPTVPLHVIYADLLGSNDPRNMVMAKHIYDKVIERVHHSEY